MRGKPVVYLTASSQSEAASQQQDDVPGHSLVNDLPAQQSRRSLHLFTCGTQETENCEDAGETCRTEDQHQVD